MFDLVLWSGSLALTPWALVLAWKLISGVAGQIGPAVPAGSTPPRGRGPEAEAELAAVAFHQRRKTP
jgi:hypothetical protein